MCDLLAREAAVPPPGAPDAFGKLNAVEVTTWGKLIKDNQTRTE